MDEAIRKRFELVRDEAIRAAYRLAEGLIYTDLTEQDPKVELRQAEDHLETALAGIRSALGAL